MRSFIYKSFERNDVAACDYYLREIFKKYPNLRGVIPRLLDPALVNFVMGLPVYREQERMDGRSRFPLDLNKPPPPELNQRTRQMTTENAHQPHGPRWSRDTWAQHYNEYRQNYEAFMQRTAAYSNQYDQGHYESAVPQVPYGATSQEPIHTTYQDVSGAVYYERATPFEDANTTSEEHEENETTDFSQEEMEIVGFLRDRFQIKRIEQADENIDKKPEQSERKVKVRKSLRQRHLSKEENILATYKVYRLPADTPLQEAINFLSKKIKKRKEEHLGLNTHNDVVLKQLYRDKNYLNLQIRSSTKYRL